MNAHEDRLRRCDRCSAAAKFEVLTPSGDLRLCEHHCRQHGKTLTDRYPVMAIAGAQS